MSFQGTSTRPLDNISAFIGNALPALLRQIGKSISYAIRGALIYALLGTICSYMITLIPAISSQAVSRGYSLPVYLVIAGAFCGAMIGFVRGLKRGVKQIITGHSTSGLLFQEIIESVVRNLDGPESADRMKLMLRDLARQTHYLDLRHYTLIAMEDKLSAGFVQTFSQRIGDCLQAASDQISRVDFANTDKNQVIERFTGYCRSQACVLLGQSVDGIFSKYVLITYVVSAVLIILPVLLFGFLL